MKAFSRLVGCGVAFAAIVAAGGDFVEVSKTEAFREGEKVLFLGDSITHGGWYVAQLQYIWQLRNPGRRVTFVNCGICGNRAKNGLDRFDWDVAPEMPDRIFIMFGMNDVGHGAYWNPDEWVEELRKANLSGGHYYRYYGGEVKHFKELYPKREAEKARLERLREEMFEYCRNPEPFEIAVEPKK